MENTQDPNQITPDEAKASLGVATNLMSQLMPQKPQEAPETAPKQAEKPPKEEDTNSELNGIKQQIIGLKEEIEKALKEDDGQDKTPTT